MTGYTKEESHRIALERIDEVARSGKTKLDLNLLGLTTVPAEIGELSNLTHLNLDGNSLISFPVEIKNLTKLNTLEIPSCKLEVLPAEIAELTSLTKLYLNNNSLTVFPSEIFQLPNLVLLDISGNKIINLPAEIGKLSNLVRLSIMSNRLNVLPDEVFRLTKLKELFLADNQFAKLPDNIYLLKNLTKLDLTGTRLTDLPITILQLNDLQELILTANRLNNLPEGIGQLTKLTKLDISFNQFSEISPEIGTLENLVCFWADNNKLSALPSETANLKKLKELSLNNNNFSEFPDVITELEALEVLEIRNIGTHKDSEENATVNKISKLPNTLYKLQNLKKLYLNDNQLPIPPEILDGYYQPKLILGFYFSNVKRRINESKILIVGQGSVGKTSLVDQILFGRFDPNRKKTEGISINQWKVPVSEKHESDSEIKTNIWDFGGQEIMHATHQFFLTKRSLYLLVLDSCLAQEENRVEYWLKIIQSFGGESPVLIVGNKIDQHPLDLNKTGLKEKYPNIVGFLETSAATGSGIEALKAAIAKQVNNLPHVRDLLPETWFTVKTKLEELGRESNFITHDKYLDLCTENEISDETSQRTLIGFLHDLGVVLHFQDDPRLEALGILNPQWVTNGVYKILNSHTLFQNKGVLTTSMLDEILNLPEYPRGKRLFIVDIMKKFELCYDLEPDKTFLVPDLLPKDEPHLDFNGIPAFEYAYPVLPSSVITRFIVRMNQKIDDGLVWRTGVVLKIGSNTALVKADIEDKKITIAIDGLEHTRRDALSAIRYQLDEIHNSIKGLNPQKRVPIPNSPNAEPLEYDYLLMLEREGQETHLVKDGNRLVKFNVREVLSAIENESQRKETGGNVTNIYIGGDVKGSTIISGDNNVVLNQKIQDSFNKAEAANIQAELKETLKQLAEAVGAMNKSLPEEQAIEVTEDLGKLVDEATKPKPNKKWYSVSVEGLIKAAENLDKVGEPVINLSRKVLSLLTGGVIE